MKKIFLVCIGLLLLAGKSAAQYASYGMSTAELKQRMALNAPHLYKRYNTGSTLSGIGAGLTLGGVGAMVFGIATADQETVKTGTGTQVNLSGTGAVIFAGGLVSAIIGTPLWIVGHSQKRNARNNYIRQFGYSDHVPVRPSPYLQLNTSQDGVGLALVF